MKKTVLLFGMAMVLTVHGVSQDKNKLYALTYKFKKGDVYTISLNTYYTLSSTASGRTSYGESSFEVKQEIENVDAKLIDVRIKAALTRCSINGKNLTYKLGDVFSNKVFFLTLDRFGKLYQDSLFVQTGGEGIQGFGSDFSYVMNPLPDYPVKEGDSWDVAEYVDEKQFEKMLNLTELAVTDPKVRGRYTLVSVTDNVAKISSDIEISGGGSMDAMPTVEFLMKLTGIYFLDLTTGIPASGQITTELAAVAPTGTGDINFRASRSVNFVVEQAN